MSEGQGAPDDAQNWLVGSADVKNVFHQMRMFFDCSRRFFALRPLFSHPKLVTQEND